MRRAVLDEFMSLDGASAKSTLLAALSDCDAGRQPLIRKFEFDRYEVTLEGTTAVVVIEDVIDASEDGMVRVSFAEFKAALGAEDATDLEQG